MNMLVKNVVLQVEFIYQKYLTKIFYGLFLNRKIKELKIGSPEEDNNFMSASNS